MLKTNGVSYSLISLAIILVVYAALAGMGSQSGQNRAVRLLARIVVSARQAEAQPGGCPKHDKCVFLASPGRSASTALMDALNQLPRVFVRGENNNMLQHLYNLDEIAARMSRRSTAAGDGAVHEKKMYENYVFKLGRKPAWYNEFDADAVQCAKVSYFNNLFGYGRFKDYIVGFKEIRFSAVRDALVNATKSVHSTYKVQFRNESFETFHNYLEFYKSLCVSTKFVFNARRSYDYEKGQGFFTGERAPLLKQLITWMDNYTSLHRTDVYWVYFEDMFDPGVNGTVADGLAAFLGVGKPNNFTFARLPRSAKCCR